jgi:hypothetical protein
MVARARAEADRPGQAAPAPDRRRWVKAGAWVATAAAAALAGVLVTRGGSDADAEFARLVTAYASDATTGAWRSPTDALLEVPGSALMRSVPVISGVPGLGVPRLGAPELPDVGRVGDSL